jgi:glutamate mutase epsilon subunit
MPCNTLESSSISQGTSKLAGFTLVGYTLHYYNRINNTVQITLT